MRTWQTAHSQRPTRLAGLHLGVLGVQLSSQCRPAPEANRMRTDFSRWRRRGALPLTGSWSASSSDPPTRASGRGRQCARRIAPPIYPSRTLFHATPHDPPHRTKASKCAAWSLLVVTSCTRGQCIARTVTRIVMLCWAQITTCLPLWSPVHFSPYQSNTSRLCQQCLQSITTMR